ncbi:MAG: carboxypeptidase M32 [Rickettsiales bacterium]
MIHSYSKLCNFYKKIAHLGNLAGIIHWDMACNMPTGAAKYRGEEVATLRSMIHKLVISDQFGDLIEEANSTRLSDWQQGNIREMKRMREDALSVETRLLEVQSIAASECEFQWREARKNNDFKSLIPNFRKVISITNDIAKARADYFGLNLYDALLDQYDTGMRSSKIDPVFKTLSEHLPKLLDKILDKQKSKKVKPLPEGRFPVAKQEELAKYLMEKLKFDFNRGAISRSTHPFCGGNPHDVRITNRYDEKDFFTGMMGVIHETGHALYEQNAPEEYIGQPIGSNLGMSVHESQSLMTEMQISRSKEFYEFITPKLIQLFNLNSKIWTPENIYNNRIKVERSLIRVDADEVTYPLHVILRYNLEKELLTGNLQIRDLPSTWNTAMQKLIGIKPKNDANGCMQDIHWYMGAIGYFPTYTLGAIYSSQFYAAMAKDLKDIKKLISAGEFGPIVSWLNKNIHNKGRMHPASELLKKVTGKEIDPDTYLQHLKQRYLG